MIGKDTERERIFTDEFGDKGTKMNSKWLYMQKRAETEIGNNIERKEDNHEIRQQKIMRRRKG